MATPNNRVGFFSQGLVMTPQERKTCDFLVVDEDASVRDNVKKALRSLGFESMYFANEHIAAIRILETRQFTHTIFSTKETNMPVPDFLIKVFAYDEKMVAIPCSANPHVDDVFELLRIGARGFLIKPFTAEMLEMSVLMASKGEPLSDAILHARDRNEAFSALIAANLDKVATAHRQNQKLGPMLSNNMQSVIDLKACAELGKMFAKGGEECLRDRMVDFFIELSKGPASRLGRLRLKLRNKRKGAPLDGAAAADPHSASKD